MARDQGFSGLIDGSQLASSMDGMFQLMSGIVGNGIEAEKAKKSW